MGKIFKRKKRYDFVDAENCTGLEWITGLDGTVVATRNNYYGQCDVSDWTDIVAISAVGDHTVGLKADGTVVTSGTGSYDHYAVADWENILLP